VTLVFRSDGIEVMYSSLVKQAKARSQIARNKLVAISTAFSLAAAGLVRTFVLEKKRRFGHGGTGDVS
jgi:hypothetical protein